MEWGGGGGRSRTTISRETRTRNTSILLVLREIVPLSTQSQLDSVSMLSSTQYLYPSPSILPE